MSSKALAAKRLNRQQGVYIGLLIIGLWSAMLLLNFLWAVNWSSPWTYLRILIQAHLFTGLFITAHDAMHGTVAPGRPGLNHSIGRFAAFLFIFNRYKKLRPKHYAHHRHVGTQEDPDFHRGSENFFRWLFDFIKEYINIWQILLAAITYNVLKFVVAEENLILYWIIPSFLSLLQLFYFGTYLPHRGEHAHENPHHARSQRKNHLWAFLSCYFFGYHYEHHDAPGTPWWQLWRMKR